MKKRINSEILEVLTKRVILYHLTVEEVEIFRKFVLIVMQQENNLRKC